MSEKLYCIYLLSGLLLVTACTGTASKLKPPATVPRVDLARYTGTWYEIARYPNRFQRGCGETTAFYALRNDGKVEVVNRCRTEKGEKVARGIARVVDPETNARLKVTFFWPFSGDYWILDLGDRYDYAVVGTPDRKYLWVLNRTPAMETRLYEGLLERIRQLGFDPELLQRTGMVTEGAAADHGEPSHPPPADTGTGE